MVTSTLQLTDEQHDCVTFDRRHDLLIKGPAGSGKTIVLLLRGAELHKAQGGSVRFLTFANALAANAEHVSAQVLVPQAQSERPAISSYHSWCAQRLARLGIHHTVVEADDQGRLLNSALAEVRARTYSSSSKVRENPLVWWRDEVAWMKGTLLPNGRPIASPEDYVSAARIGRGAALQPAVRAIVWDVYERYQRALDARSLVDWEDLTRSLLAHYHARSGTEDYRQIVVPPAEQTDHLLIDEAQDLHQLELLALARFARRSLTLVADQTQKIYKTTFSWASVGLTFDAGNVRSLRDNFRSTKQIVELALPLMPLEEMAEVRLPRREGPLPTLYVAADPHQEDVVLCRLVSRYALEHPGQTIGVFARGWDQVRVWQARLAALSSTPVDLIRRQQGSALTAGVKLTTLHSSKGLEFDAVIIPRLTEGVLPTAPRDYHADASSEDSAEHYAYEQRLLYVAMTRARHALYLITSGAPSRFLGLLEPARYRRAAVPDQ